MKSRPYDSTVSISGSKLIRNLLAQASEFIGLEATESALTFLWDAKVAAVASDAPSFERAPIGGGSGSSYPVEDVDLRGATRLHEVLLAGWECPIGELFDLEALGEKCHLLNWWTFFFSSVPLNVRSSTGRSSSTSASL